MTQGAGGYTANEISGATQQLVQTSIRYNNDSLGVPQTNVTFSDVQQAAIGLFLLFPTAPFYVVELGASRLNEELQTQAAAVAQLLALVQASGRLVLPVNDVTPLSNAKAALSALQGAAAQRSTAFGDMSKIPSFQTFSSNVDHFLSTNGSSIKSGGQVVPTPQEAKAQMPALLSKIVSTQQDLISKAALLQGALVDYNNADLPAVATSSIFTNAERNIASLVAQLEAQSPTDRLSSLRSTALQLLATKAVVQQAGSFTRPTSNFQISGAGAPYADTTHPAFSASLPSTLYAPYNIQGSPLLTVALDGQPPVSKNLNNALFAELFGNAQEPFVITVAGAASMTGSASGPFTVTTNTNDTLAFTATEPVHGTPVQVSLTVGAGTVSAAALATSLNSKLLSNYPEIAAAYSITHAGNQIVISATGTGSAFGIRIQSGNMNSLIGFTLGQQAVGVDDNRVLKIKETASSTVYTLSIPAGTYSAAAMAAFISGAGTPFTAFAQGLTGHQFIDIRYTTPGPTPVFSAGIMFPSSPANPIAQLLGMPMDIAYSAKASNARTVAASLTTLFPTLKADVSVDSLIGGANLNIRTEPSDPARFVAYKVSASGAAAPAGPNTISIATPSGNLAAGVVVGDTLVVRSGANASTVWVVSVVTDTGVTATGTVTAVAGSCSFEIGPTLTISPGYVVQIPGSGPNNGIYTITQQGATVLHVPFEFEVDSIIHGVTQPNGQPYVMVGNIGREKVVFNSTNVTLSSSVNVSGAASSLFFSSLPPTAIGTTPWVQLPAAVPNLGTSDKIELFISTYNIPDFTFNITSVDGTIVGVSPPMSDVQTFTFADGVPPPFASLVSGAFSAFTFFSAQLKTWLKLPANQSAYFPQLRVLLNAVINEGQATPTQVSAAIQQLTLLQDALVQASSQSPSSTLEFALISYSVGRVPAVDNLVTMYTEQGCSAALDTLLQGKFSTFFGLDQNTSSYAGAVQSQIRTIAQNDLPVRKVDRTSAVRSQVIASMSSPDFEYDSSDIDKTSPPDFTGNSFDQTSPSNIGNT